MKTLWTPWRMRYVEGQIGREEGCLFETAPDRSHDREALILFRDPLSVILLNRFPYAHGHLLLAPARHVAALEDLSPREAELLMTRLQQATMIINKHLRPDGINIGLNLGEAAGAGLADHLHFHLIPRWLGDHNFMTPMAEVRTIPEHILETFDRLLDKFIDLPETMSDLNP
ncbi:MAG: HIT domain-containing protein [Proteobacteria bacterium]|nr:HIT domain-containing protein [Pseudomonadota bacterium]MBU1686280.1 HIT domain-containing protein [Pseudomonadota bacterium]